MRATIVFEVSGPTHEALINQALETYRSYLGNESVVLPPNAHIDVSPSVEAVEGTIVAWSAQVTISVNNSTFS